MASILVVEDEFLVAMTIENELTDAGFTIAGVASTADEAVALARETKPTLVVMDVRLAGKRDGVDAALRIFAETGTRCVFATANADAAVRERAAAAKPLFWLQKPYNGPALIAAVRDALKALAEGKPNG